MNQRMMIDEVRDQYAGVAIGRVVQRLVGRPIHRIGVRILGGRTEPTASRSQHGAVLRQPFGTGRHSRRRSRRRPRLRRWHGCVSGCSQSWPIGPRDRHRHDGGDARTSSRRPAETGTDKRRVPSVDDRSLATARQLVDCVISNCVINLVPDKLASVPRDPASAQARRTRGAERHCS
jgi:hypothetical protein